MVTSRHYAGEQGSDVIRFSDPSGWPVAHAADIWALAICLEPNGSAARSTSEIFSNGRPSGYERPEAILACIWCISGSVYPAGVLVGTSYGSVAHSIRLITQELVWVLRILGPLFVSTWLVFSLGRTSIRHKPDVGLLSSAISWPWSLLEAGQALCSVHGAL